MLALADVVHLFPNKFPRLRGRRFALPPVAPGPFDGLFFWHDGISIGRGISELTHAGRLARLFARAFARSLATVSVFVHRRIALFPQIHSRGRFRQRRGPFALSFTIRECDI